MLFKIAWTTLLLNHSHKTICDRVCNARTRQACQFNGVILEKIVAFPTTTEYNIPVVLLRLFNARSTCVIRKGVSGSYAPIMVCVIRSFLRTQSFGHCLTPNCWPQIQAYRCRDLRLGIMVRVCSSILVLFSFQNAIVCVIPQNCWNHILKNRIFFHIQGVFVYAY